MTFIAIITAALIGLAAQDHSAHQAQGKPTAQAFEHYEGVRAALAGDNFAAVATHATALAAAAEGVGGPSAKKAADQLAAAKSIEEARKHFGELSTILVPVFQKENIPGATAFMCSMKKQPWMQKGDKVENPYYGKSMLTCGSRLPAKGK